MTEHYVTLFDSGFLPNGLALHRSLQRHAGDHHLWVVAMDTTVGDALRGLALPDVSVIDLADAEDERLRSVRPSRTRGEYCWTLTPFTPALVLARAPDAARATYVDADMWLTASPARIFDELAASGRSVLITPHAYAPEYDQSAVSGIYCVQFMPFVRGASDEVAHWWQDRCLEWCYARFEDGKFGDQKYLDDWPTRFPEQVHVLADLPALQAPWNAGRFDPRDAVAFHFHEVRTRSADRVRLGHYRIPDRTLDTLYRPYLADLAWALDLLGHAGVTPPVQRPWRGAWPEAKDWIALRLLDRTPPRSPLSLRLPR